MTSLKVYILFILMFFSSYCNADDYKHIIKLDNINVYLQEGKKSSFLFEEQLVNDLKKVSIIQDKVKKISITINLHNKSTISFSNLNPEKCEIGINYNIKQWNLIGDIFNNFYDELLFNILHEIGHCYLSRKVLLNDIDWILPLSKDVTSNLNNIIDESSNYQFKQSCPNCTKEAIFNKTPLKIVYHEIYADTFASYFFKTILDKKIHPLIDFRTKVFNQNNNSLYPTQFSLKYLESNKNNLQSIENILKYTQLGFYDYLKNINKDIY